MSIDGSTASRLLYEFLVFEDTLEVDNDDHLDELMVHFEGNRQTETWLNYIDLFKKYNII